MCSNLVAVLSQWAIMLFVCSFQIFMTGAINYWPKLLVGSMPVIVLMALVCYTLHSVVCDMRTYEIQNINSTASADDETSKHTDVTVQTSAGDEITMPLQRFEELYEPIHMPASALRRLGALGHRAYRSKAQVWAHQLSKEDVANYFPTGQFISRTGRTSSVHVGQYITLPFPRGQSLTVVDQARFSRDYTTRTEGGAESRVLSQAETLRQWDAVLRREAKIFSKKTKVHAKIAEDDGEIKKIVNGIEESTEPYFKGDYILCGSRGGKFPMRSRDFSLRYDTANPEPGTDVRLASIGFRLFKATGQVWAHRLTTDEVASNFPGVGSFGKCACTILLHLCVITPPL